MEQITDPDSPRFLTLAEAAERLRVNPSTLSRQCANGLFPHVRVGRVVRIPAAELERLEAGEPARSSMLDVPDYGTGTPSMFNGIPEADSPEDVDERPNVDQARAAGEQLGKVMRAFGDAYAEAMKR